MNAGRRCDATGKIRYRDSTEAKWALTRIRTSMDQRERIPVRWYENCPFCRGIHLTSQEGSAHGKTIWIDEEGNLHGFQPLPDVDED